MRPAGSLLMVVAVALLAGCGGTSATSTVVSGDTLSIYTDVPLHGPRAAIGRAVYNGEKLALHESAGHVGNRSIELVALDDTDPAKRGWAPGKVAANARQATHNPTTVAYIGDVDSGATAVSVPITNAVGVLQVSPLSGYTGLTQPGDKGEPDKYYPTGKRTFARVVPSDRVEANALAGWIKSLGFTKVGMAYDGLQEGLGQGGELQKALTAKGVAVPAVVRVDPDDDAGDVSGDARELARSGVPAVVYAGASTPAALALLRAVHDRRPADMLFTTSGVAGGPLVRGLRSAESQVRLTSPLLPARVWPAAAHRMSGRYRSLFGAPAPPAALYGYEAMRGVLAAIRRAGPAGNDRQAVTDAYFRTTAPASVLGPYVIDARGDTTDIRYGGFSVSEGRLKLEQMLDSAD